MKVKDWNQIGQTMVLYALAFFVGVIPIKGPDNGKFFFVGIAFLLIGSILCKIKSRKVTEDEKI